MTNAVDHPRHYNAHPSGKGRTLEDLEKAAWYIRREIERRAAQPAADPSRA